ncbi:DUF2442 domain-containing protein [Eubacteriaceae bacterium ES3]|nr:DUF2442 domain-containing protein [Eubacteriaceae bacterium ES3]
MIAMYEVDGILYAGKPADMVTVTGVKPLQGYQLLLTFSTGERKIYDATHLLELSAFQPLKNPAVFNDVQIDFDTVTWCNGDVDIAPETLYKESVVFTEIKEA